MVINSCICDSGCFNTRWDYHRGNSASVPGWDLDVSPPAGHQQFCSRKSECQRGKENPCALWPTSVSSIAHVLMRVIGCFRCLKVVGAVRQSFHCLAVTSAPPYLNIVKWCMTCADTSEVCSHTLVYCPMQSIVCLLGSIPVWFFFFFFAFTSQVGLGINWLVGIALLHFRFWYSTPTVAQCVWPLHHMRSRHGGLTYYELQHNIRAQVRRRPPEIQVGKAFWSILDNCYMAFYTSICTFMVHLLPISALAWRITRIQGLRGCRAFSEKAQGKESQRGAFSRRWRGGELRNNI